MIDLVYKTVQTLLQKEQKGYVTPEQFNELANYVQYEIFREYFDDHNRAQSRQNVGRVNEGYGDLAFNIRQKIQQFAAFQVLIFENTTQAFTLPLDLYQLEQDGLTTGTNKVIEEVQRSEINYLSNSLAAPSINYPVYEKYNTFVRVFPSTITTGIQCRYLRKPKPVKWTFMNVSGNPFFNPAALDYQDFELNETEFSTIVMRLCSLFGLTIRETEVVQIAETMKDKANANENN